MIIQGIFLLIAGIGIMTAYLFASYYSRAHLKGFIDGEIIESDVEAKEVVIRYTFNDAEYSSRYGCDAYADVGEMPPAGLKVRILVNEDEPEEILYVKLMHKAGRGVGSSREYIDSSSKSRRFGITAVAILFLLGGLCFILEELSII